MMHLPAACCSQGPHPVKTMWDVFPEKTNPPFLNAGRVP